MNIDKIVDRFISTLWVELESDNIWFIEKK